MEEYKRQIGKLAVAQLCQVMGFSSISSQALDTLEEVMSLLIEKIGERAKLLAEHSNRTECNFLDTLQSLEVIQCTEEIITTWLSQNSEFTFCKNVKFYEDRQQVKKNIQPITYANNIPSFLPPFPPDHTYLFTPVPITRDMDAATLRSIKIKEKREIEERLSNIAGNTSMPSSSSSSLPTIIKNPYISLGLLQTTQHLINE